MKYVLHSLFIVLFFHISVVQAAVLPKLHKVSLTKQGEITRIAFEFDRHIDYQLFTLENPHRFVIDLPALHWQVKEGESRENELITKFRHGFFTPNTYRIVLDLKQPIHLKQHVVTQNGQQKQHRLLLELTKAEAKTFQHVFIPRKNQEVAKKHTSLAVIKPAAKETEKPVIVIDPGHGGIDPGAKSLSGIYEKHLVLNAAKELKKQLEKGNKYRVYLTRDTDVYLALKERRAFAKKKGANLFISIHADQIKNPKIRGSSVYTISEKASDAEAHALAESENRSDIIAGIDLSHEDDQVMSILIDLAQRETKNLSSLFAQEVIEELSKVHKTLPKSHRYAGFAVLKSPDIPSVLVELGYLSNALDEKMLKQADQRKKIINALSTAVDGYFAVHQEWAKK